MTVRLSARRPPWSSIVLPDRLRCHMNNNYEIMLTTAQTRYMIRYYSIETGFWEKACAMTTRIVM